MIAVAVIDDRLDCAALGGSLAVTGAGGIASFTGVVRSDDGVSALTLEHYPGMTEAALRKLAETAATRWSLLAATIVHRVGTMVPGDPIVFVGAAAAHRGPALEACAFLIDRLKTDAPFWKREQVDGVDRWVDARDGDRAAADGWN